VLLEEEGEGFVKWFQSPGVKQALRLSPDSLPQFFRLSARLAMAQARPTSPENGEGYYLRRLECMVYLDEFESLMLDYANGIGSGPYR
jgi:hypothetical protein